MATDTGRLLVVDDDENNRDMLSRRLIRRGFEVELANDGDEALTAIADGRYDLILLDVMMPRLNGFDALTIIRQTHSLSELPVIMATAKDQTEDIVQALEAGANDYVTKPLDFPVVLARVHTQLALKRAMDLVKALEKDLEARNVALQESNGQLKAINARMAKDLAAAARVQEATLPKKLPRIEGAEFAWIFHPCDELAGDGLNVVPLDEHRVGLYLLDVSGHGVASALLSVALARLLSPLADASSILRVPVEGSATPRIVPPVEVADQLNRRFGFDTLTEQYFTIVYGILDIETGEYRYISAGHPGLAHLPADGSPKILETPGFPIGFSDDAYEEHAVQLAPGDRLVIYSDGVTEAMDAKNAQFGGERLLNALVRARSATLKESLEAALSAITTWVAPAHFRDDVSMLAVEYRRSSGE